MKKKIIILSMTLLIAFALGGTLSWFYAEDSVIETQKIATIKVRASDGNEDVKVQNLGTGDAYVRVRLVPSWSDHNLSISNVTLNLNTGSDWTSKKADGYYYYTKVLQAGESTSNIINNISYSNQDPEYSGQTFTLKTVAEGVQINNKALEAVWGINSIPKS